MRLLVTKSQNRNKREEGEEGEGREGIHVCVCLLFIIN